VSARLRARSARLAVVVSAALVLLLPAAPVRAASFAFSGLDAVSQFDQGIDFSARLTASETPARVDLQLLMPGAAGPFVVTIPNTPPSGTSTVRYTLDTSGALDAAGVANRRGAAQSEARSVRRESITLGCA